MVDERTPDTDDGEDEPSADEAPPVEEPVDSRIPTDEEE